MQQHMKIFRAVVNMIDKLPTAIEISLCFKNKRMKIIALVFLGTFVISCTPDLPQWKFVEAIDLGDVTPIGIAEMDNHLWISDGDHNRLVHLEKSGKVLYKVDSFERPMHIATNDNQIYIPEYGTDKITVFSTTAREPLVLKDSLDAPAGVAVRGTEIAIADFYNHRILYTSDGVNWLKFGEEGKAKGQLYYPTDVELTDQKIYVADAYNNRVQVFDKSGKSISLIGVEQKMNATTGVYVSDQEIMATDFENDKVHIYDMMGQFRQTVEGLSKPTDLLIVDGLLYIINYKGKSMTVMEKN